MFFSHLHSLTPPMTTFLGKSYNFLAFQQAALLIYLSATFFFSEIGFFWWYLCQTSPSLWWIVYLLLFCEFEIVPLLFIFLRRAMFYNKQIWIFLIFKPWSWSFSVPYEFPCIMHSSNYITTAYITTFSPVHFYIFIEDLFS